MHFPNVNAIKYMYSGNRCEEQQSMDGTRTLEYFLNAIFYDHSLSNILCTFSYILKSNILILKSSFGGQLGVR